MVVGQSLANAALTTTNIIVTSVFSGILTVIPFASSIAEDELSNHILSMKRN